MAAPQKRRNINVDEKKSLGEESDEFDENDTVRERMEIQVDFEGRNPIESDFHGIKQLLSQLFLKSHINISELTQIIIGQNHIGSVIKQSLVEDEADDDDEDCYPNDVFGVTTVISLTDKQELECVSQLKALLLKLSAESGSGEVASLIRNILSDVNEKVGLLINERFVNIPPQISVPLLKSLRDELKRAAKKKMQYDFSYLILICKLYKMEQENDKKKSKKSKKNNKISEIIWSNPEEEVIDQEAEARFEFSVKGEADSGLVGEWEEDDKAMIPMRRVLVIKYNKYDDIIEKVEEAVSA